jgi:hypothetical protein
VSSRERWIAALSASTWGLVAGYLVAAFGWTATTVIVVVGGIAACLVLLRLTMDEPRTWRRIFSVYRTGKPVGKRWILPAVVAGLGVVSILVDSWIGLVWIVWAAVMVSSMVLAARQPRISEF